MASEKRPPLKIERPVDLRGMKSLNELQRREVTAYIEACFEEFARVMAEERERERAAVLGIAERRFWRPWWRIAGSDGDPSREA